MSVAKLRQGLPEWPRKVGNQPFRSNWLRSLSAMAWIISQRSASCCGPSHMIATFHESSWGTTEIARFVGHSLMSSISSLMAASSSSRVFAGFFKCPSLSGRRNGTTAFGYPLPPPSTDGGRCPTSQRLCLDNVPTAVTSPEASRGCRRESPSSSVLEAFAVPSTVIGFKLDNLRTSRLPPPEHEAMRFAIALCGPVDPTPPRF